MRVNQQSASNSHVASEFLDRAAINWIRMKAENRLLITG
jgi:hypothetical protein